MLHPSTPTKADDGIERLKQSLSAKWGIQFPNRDSAWSPSRRDPNRVEEKILAIIQFLYFREGALHHAIEQFEKTAATINSQWQYKPRGEAGVIPSRGEGRDLTRESAVKQDFLHKRAPLEESAIKDLTESLWHHLCITAERVKGGEKYAMPVMPSIEKSASMENTPAKKDQARRQSSLTQWFRSKSDPNAAPSTALQPSSDDFQEEDMTDVFSEILKTDAAPIFPISATSGSVSNPKSRRLSNQTSFTEEKFETPATTPPQLRGGHVGMGIGVEDSADDFYRKNPELVPVMNRKRFHPEPMKHPLPRKVSRETRSRDVYNVDHLAPTTKPSNVSGSAFIMPTPPPNDQPFFTRSFSRNQSAENLTSISSSMTNASSVCTSANTSFTSDSMATSFTSSTGGDTDTTIRPMSDKSWNSRLPGKSAMQSEADENEWEQFYQAQAIKPPHMKSTTSYPIQGMAFEKTSDQQAHEPQNDPMNEEPIKDTTMAPPLGSMRSAPPPTSLEKQVADRLRLHSPFVSVSREYSAVPLRQLYEVIRVSTCCKLPLTAFSECLKQNQENLDDLWSSLISVARSTGLQAPERSSAVAWAKAGGSFEGVSLSGRLRFADRADGPLFDLTLNPLRTESSYRLARKYGHDRFCVIGIPSIGLEGLPSRLKPDNTTSAAVREMIINWLVKSRHYFLGRTWRAFFVKPDSGKKTQKSVKNSPSDVRFRVFLFAEDGIGFRNQSVKGEIDPRTHNHVFVSVKEAIEWFMSSRNNPNQSCLKFFSRIALGLTSTTPTVTFSSREIIRTDDAYADNPRMRCLDLERSGKRSTSLNQQRSKAAVMNDGCARISRDAANAVAAMLGIDHTPSVFQGRIGGAKGVWMVDTLEETPLQLTRVDGKTYWIEITDSQLKFAPHSIDTWSPDTARVTFEVNKYSNKLSSGFLNFQLMPILEKGGVPSDVFKDLLREDLSSRIGELEVAMEDGLSMRKWNQDKNSVAGERVAFGGIEMLGALPESRAEKINWFLESGFEPKNCLFLKSLLYKAAQSYCRNLENRMNIGLGRSTNAYMIADPLAVLEEGEIHLSFSSVFRDTKSGFDETMLHGFDVLVARLPAHLPSDIQKVRAVFKPELRAYRDVVVFASRGEVPLASKLSGGDYDGDRAWLCWDPQIVEPFRHVPVPDLPAPKLYGIETDSTKVSDILHLEDYMNRFLVHSFSFNIQMNMLGICTNYHETLCYHTNTIASNQAIHIAALLGHLVDSNKQGYKFDDSKWIAYLKRSRLPKKHNAPAYKDKDRARPKDENLIDDLVFNVAKKERQEALKKFTEHFEDVESWDEDLMAIRQKEAEEAKTNQALATVLKNLKSGLDDIHNFWRDHCRREDEEDEPALTRKGNTISFRAIVERCRQDFVTLAPITIKNIMSTASDESAEQIPDTICRWQRAHAAGKPSYWDLLKASVAFYHLHKTNFVWHVAGIELGQIKAMSKGGGSYRVVVNNMFDLFKLDGKLVDGAKRREMQMQADRAVRIADEEDADNDEETVYGSAWSQVNPNDFGF